MAEQQILGMNAGILVAVFFGIILLFLIFRELNCWYWKINARLQEAKLINEKLDRLIALNGGSGNPQLKGKDE